MISKLLGLLIQMALKPRSGYGETIIIWKNGEIILLTVKEEIKPEHIN